jgi:hypothetical protein
MWELTNNMNLNGFSYQTSQFLGIMLNFLKVLFQVSLSSTYGENAHILPSSTEQEVAQVSKFI